MRSLIIFDGVCNLCNVWVDFVLRRDPGDRFLFASNQSEAGRLVLESHGIDPTVVSTIYLVEGGQIFDRSTAAIRIARGLRFPWWLAGGLLLAPRGLRDLFYSLIARNRYRLFGRRSSCRVPTPEERSRFLEEAEDLHSIGLDFAASRPDSTDSNLDDSGSAS